MMVCLSGAPFIWLVLLVASVWNLCHASTAAPGYDVAPGNIRALINTTMNLKWETNIQNKIIKSCYWEQMPLGKTLWDRFLGYNNLLLERLELSFRHVGWEFTNQENPCLGGLYRHDVQPEHQGLYQMIVSSDHQEVTARGQVTILKEKDVKFQIQIQSSIYNFTLQDPTPILPRLDMTPGKRVELNVHLKDGFPSSNITVFQNEEQTVFCHDVLDCRVYISYAEPDPEETIMIQIDPDIQGAEAVIMKQPVVVTDEPCSCSCATEMFVIVLIMFIIVFIIIAVYIYVGCRRRWIKRSIVHQHHTIQLLVPFQKPIRSLADGDEDSQHETLKETFTKDQMAPLYKQLIDEYQPVVSASKNVQELLKAQEGSLTSIKGKVDDLNLKVLSRPSKNTTAKADVAKLLTTVKQLLDYLAEKMNKKSKAILKDYVSIGECKEGKEKVVQLYNRLNSCKDELENNDEEIDILLENVDDAQKKVKENITEVQTTRRNIVDLCNKCQQHTYEKLEDPDNITGPLTNMASLHKSTQSLRQIVDTLLKTSREHQACEMLNALLKQHEDDFKKTEKEQDQLLQEVNDYDSEVKKLLKK